MKIRLMGSADLVRAWGAELKRAYGITGAEYPSRYGGNEVRIYFDLDDRQAAAVVGLTTAAPASVPPSAPARGRGHRAKQLKGKTE